MKYALVKVLLGIFMLGFVAGLANAAPKGGTQAELEVLVAVQSPSGVAATLDSLRGLGTFNVDSFFDVHYLVVSNIGSSGMDGVRASVDSFFDISYEIFGDPDFDLLKIKVRGTLVGTSNPGVVLDEVAKSLQGADGAGGKFHGGHVTLMK